MDLAIYTSQEFAWEDFYCLYGELTKSLHSDRLDLVWLNKADPILKLEILKTGKVIFFRNPEILDEFELKAKKNYYDYCRYLRKHRGLGLYGLQKREPDKENREA